MPCASVLESQRPRHGRRFQPVEELSLEADAVRVAQELRGASSGLLIVREVSGPFGIPDFVALIGPGEGLAARCELAVPPLLNEIDAGVATVASPKVGRTPQELALRLGWATETVERRLPHMLRTGALIEGRSGRYVRPADLHSVGQLVAIETKVSNWRRAVRQGRTYRLWCESYVLVMPRVSIGSINDLIADIDVDLAGLVVGGKWLRRPRRRSSARARMLWGSEHLVAAIAGSSLTNPPSMRTVPIH